MEASIVLLILLFSLSSNSDISLSLLQVIFLESHSSIFFISSNIVLVLLADST